MVMNPAGLGTKNVCAGEGQQQFTRQVLVAMLLQRYNVGSSVCGVQLGRDGFDRFVHKPGLTRLLNALYSGL
jgi:hypothetical protein